MYSRLTLSAKYLKYWIRASNGKGHGIHSPFVYNFVHKVLNDRTAYPDYKIAEGLRKKLLADNTPVPIEDYGAGSTAGPRSKSVADITRHASKSAKYGQLLYRIVAAYHPHYILELGTSLGMSSAYMALADRSSVIVTGEGNYAVASLARNNFDSIGITNVRIIAGDFKNTLPEMVSALPQIDLAFIDANHRKAPTLAYFHELLKKTEKTSIIIFDDIHWSRGMEEAWQNIKDHPSVTLTIDLFFFGIVIFDPAFHERQHFTIRY